VGQYPDFAKARVDNTFVAVCDGAPAVVGPLKGDGEVQATAGAIAALLGVVKHPQAHMMMWLICSSDQDAKGQAPALPFVTLPPATARSMTYGSCPLAFFEKDEIQDVVQISQNPVATRLK